MVVNHVLAHRQPIVKVLRNLIAQGNKLALVGRGQIGRAVERGPEVIVKHLAGQVADDVGVAGNQRQIRLDHVPVHEMLLAHEGGGPVGQIIPPGAVNPNREGYVHGTGERRILGVQRVVNISAAKLDEGHVRKVRADHVLRRLGLLRLVRPVKVLGDFEAHVLAGRLQEHCGVLPVAPKRALVVRDEVIGVNGVNVQCDPEGVGDVLQKDSPGEITIQVEFARRLPLEKETVIDEMADVKRVIPRGDEDRRQQVHIRGDRAGVLLEDEWVGHATARRVGQRRYLCQEIGSCQDVHFGPARDPRWPNESAQPGPVGRLPEIRHGQAG